MKDPKDTVTSDIFQQDTLKWCENNVETLTREHDGNFKLSYIDGNYFKFAEAKQLKNVLNLLGVNMTDYEIFNWLYAHVVFIERLKSGKFAVTYTNLSGNEAIIVGDDIKDCVRRANNV